MSFRTIIAIVAVLLSPALPSAAQTVAAPTVRVQFTGGLVTVVAQNASLRQILAEWARLGGTTFVNAERVPATPVTLELQNVTERQALEVLLRSVSGYMVAAREVSGPGASSFDRILIVPTSTAPRPSATVLPPPVSPVRNLPQQFQIGQQVLLDQDDPEENPPDDVAPGDSDEERPNPRVRIVNPARPFVPPAANGRPLPPQPFQPAPEDDDAEPQRPAPASNPFGVQPGSVRPGVITPVPQQPQNRQPRPDQEP